MPKRQSHKAGSELFIVDNSNEEWKALRYLRDWCPLSKSIDIATGYFEIGSLLKLEGEWQKVDHIRILMGDEISKRTRDAFIDGLREICSNLDKSIEREKEKNFFLDGVPAIVKAIQSGKIECRVYRKDKFHAKAYITHARLEVVGSSALVGSSNFTVPGLTQNIELNVQITGTPVAVLQEWYEDRWEEAEDISDEILKVINHHTREFEPFDIYARSLQLYFSGHEETATEWERSKSKIYPILAKYQRDGYGALLKRAEKYGGAFLCDGVGLGKTFIGLMLIERFVQYEKKNVALFVPKSAKSPVWERELSNRLPDVFKGFSRLKVFSHTDLLREKKMEELNQVKNQADVIIIDEAHHFRNTGKGKRDDEEPRSRYWHMYDIIDDKNVYFLTATPINNSLLDFQHMVELFSRHNQGYFSAAPLGIHSLRRHIMQLEESVERQILSIETQREGQYVEFNTAAAGELISRDFLFDALVVQRSRRYVKESMRREGGSDVVFPEPRKPKVADYSVKQTYGKLLNMVANSFNKDVPLFSLAVYNPYGYYIGNDPDKIKKADYESKRRRQIVALIRTNFLKRFESSAEAFKLSCWRLLQKMVAWLDVNAESGNESAIVAGWKADNSDILEFRDQYDIFDVDVNDMEDDLYPSELRDEVQILSKDEFDIERIVQDTIIDLNQLVEFLNELRKFKPSQDKKLSKLKSLLQNDSTLKDNKVIIFSEFAETARYIAKQLRDNGIDDLEQIDSATQGDRSLIIQRFAPYYNASSIEDLAARGHREIRVLISTDILSEGLNLQDATRLINYDLHWNPVRLMQRIGRIDRRLDPNIENKILDMHPKQKKMRKTVEYWNFLPPSELDTLLRLYNRVSHKTLRISKTLGIEGKRLLREDDDFEDLRNFSEQYEGTSSPDEKLHLEWQDLLSDNPGLEKFLSEFPNSVFSGMRHNNNCARGVFFCYSRPALNRSASGSDMDGNWSVEPGDVRWYLFNLSDNSITENSNRIIDFIRCEKKTTRRVQLDCDVLTNARKSVETHITQTYLRKVQAPIGVKPMLRAWMELN